MQCKDCKKDCHKEEDIQSIDHTGFCKHCFDLKIFDIKMDFVKKQYQKKENKNELQ